MSKSSLDYYHTGMRMRRDGFPRPPAVDSWQSRAFVRGWDDADKVLKDSASAKEKEVNEIKVWINELDQWPQAAREHERFLQAEMKKILPVSRMIRLNKSLQRLRDRWDARA